MSGYILRSVASLTIVAALLSGGYVLYAQSCPDYGAIDQGCDQGQGADSGCAGTSVTCSQDIKQVSAAGKFGCGEVVGRKNCRTGTTKDLCYTRWDCEYSHIAVDCVEIAETEEEYYWWIKTDDDCAEE